MSDRPPSKRAPGAATPSLDARTTTFALIAITLLAAFLRLFHFGQSPPGLNQDEALGAWNSWCLLKTGHDMTGAAWPVFYSHGIGDFPSTLFFYVMIPFQAIGGLNVWTTRLPSIVSGILCVPLMYYVGARLFGRGIGLLASVMLAFNPWHLFLSRFGVGAAQCPLFTLLVVALMLKARLPITDSPEHEPRPLWAALAGLTAGIACYGFPPMRIYFPLFFTCIVALNPRAWWALRGSRAGVWATLLLVLAFSAAFGPLARQQLQHPVMAHRWEMTRLWPPGTPLPRVLALVAARYLAHFQPDFLFIHGGHDRIVNPLGRGAFEWYTLPIMLAGLCFALRGARNRISARLLLVLAVLYPVGDLISRYDGVHPLRSAPGLPALVLLGAFGTVAMWKWLVPRRRALATIWTITIGIIAVVSVASVLGRYFGDMDKELETYHQYGVDLVEADRWLKPRLANYDAVFFTTISLQQPFAVTLVESGWEPSRWFSEPRDVRIFAGWDIYLRVGKLRFMYAKLWHPDYLRLVADGRVEHALFIVRPGELGLTHPIYRVRNPDGRDVLWLCEEDI